MARRLLRQLAMTGAVRRAVGLVERLDSQDPRFLRVLTYHRVDRPEPFAQHVDWLLGRYRIVSVADVLATVREGKPLPRRSVLLTFDDGYRGFAAVAWPILRARGCTAALFVPTAYPDSGRASFWWDQLEHAFLHTARREPLDTPLGRLPLATPADRAAAHERTSAWIKDLPHAELLRATDDVTRELGVDPLGHEVLSWEELRALSAEGVTLGAHSRTHPRLDRLSKQEARAEALESLADLEREIPGASRVFAYPDGRYDEELVAALRSAGVQLAFTTRFGTNDVRRCDPLQIRRLNVDQDDPVPIVRAKLAAAATLEPLELLRRARPSARHQPGSRLQALEEWVRR
jgi:peptidoglycan/xylan/chitin deacetylase (PgdA/CDA1 family)